MNLELVVACLPYELEAYAYSEGDEARILVHYPERLYRFGILDHYMTQDEFCEVFSKDMAFIHDFVFGEIHLGRIL